MRVYLPATVDDLELLRDKSAELPGRQGYAISSDWVENQPDQDPEVLEHELLVLAGQASLANSKTGRRIVLVADVPVALVDSQSALVAIAGARNTAILAMFADDLANGQAISSGQNPSDLDLTWFGPSEILEILDFIQA